MPSFHKSLIVEKFQGNYLKAQVFISDRVGMVSRVIRVLLTLWKSKVSCKWSYKLNRIGIGRIRTFPFSFDSAYDSVASFRLWPSENQIVRVGSGSGRINQSQCKFPHFVIGLVLPLLLATPKTQFSLDRKQNSHKRNQNAFFTSLNLCFWVWRFWVWLWLRW